MRNDLTDITLVVDRSGSMAGIQKDAEGGVNEFIRKQAAEPGDALLTLLQFDTSYDLVHSGVPVADVPPYELEPRGMTALLDAVGRAINETGQRLAAMDEANRPGLVVFVIVTDGEENSSQEFTYQDISRMIEHQQSQYNWQFTFLAANQDAFAKGQQMGIDAAGIANFDVKKMGQTWNVANAKLSRMRKSAEMAETVDNAFRLDELKAMQDDPKQ